ncbi:acetyl esterase [Paraburkholderia sp. RAU6.4a]|uniref:alpha/beta hydrolase n=1 Tax=Paraburkholderia sp. RAU6.4a TaxID=2991067 RepID=UPI003D253EEB
MQPTDDTTVLTKHFFVAGHAQEIALRTYRPYPKASVLPIVVYFHGGGFVGGLLDDADYTATAIAMGTPAWVVSVGYSLAPRFPFPAALEDGYCATHWAVTNARQHGADARRIGVAGHDAGGNLATCLAAMARDRGEFSFAAQALLAPLLDPSMTRMADEREVPSADLGASECARGYWAYLPLASNRMHPYAAPIESRRLKGLPPALIASAQNDLLHVEAEKYAGELIAAGVPTEVTRHNNASRQALATNPTVLADVSAFFAKRLVFRPGNDFA